MVKMAFTLTGREMPRKVYETHLYGETLEVFPYPPGRTIVEIGAEDAGRCRHMLEVELDRGMFQGMTADQGEEIPLF